MGLGIVDRLMQKGTRVVSGGNNGFQTNTRIGFLLKLESADIVKEGDEAFYVLKGSAASPADGLAINEAVTVKMTPKVAEATLFHGMPRSMLPAITEGSSTKHANSEILVRGWKNKEGEIVGALGTVMSTFLTNGRLLGSKPTSKVPERETGTMLAGRPSITIVDGEKRSTVRFEALATTADSVRMVVKIDKTVEIMNVPLVDAVDEIRKAIAEQLAINKRMLEGSGMIKPVVRVDVPIFNPDARKTLAAGEGANPDFKSLAVGQYLLEASDGQTYNLHLLPLDDEKIRAAKVARAEKFVREIPVVDGVPPTVVVVPAVTMCYIKERAVKMAEAYANMLQNHYDPVPPKETWSLASSQRPNVRGWESQLSPSFHGLEKPFTPVVVSMIKFPITNEKTGEISTGYQIEHVLAQTANSFDSVLAASAEIDRISFNPAEHNEIAAAPEDDISIDVSNLDFGMSDMDFDAGLADALGEPVNMTPPPAQAPRRTRDLAM